MTNRATEEKLASPRPWKYVNANGNPVKGMADWIEDAHGNIVGENVGHIDGPLIVRCVNASPAPADSGAVADDAEPTWRDLALQFDGQRIEALSLLRYVSEARNCAEATGRASEIKAFLAKPPLSGEAILAQRISALNLPPDHGGGEGDVVREALLAARDLAKTMEGLTGCRSDDDYVWGAQAKIEAAIAALTRSQP